MVRRIFALLGILCLFAPVAGAVERETPPDFRFCGNHADCTLVVAGCGTSCDLMPVNRFYAETIREGQRQICSTIIHRQPICRTSPTLVAACVAGSCVVEEADRPQASWGNYRHPGEEGWRWDGRTAEWDRQGFTAYDLPQELVTMGRLELPDR